MAKNNSSKFMETWFNYFENYSKNNDEKLNQDNQDIINKYEQDQINKVNYLVGSDEEIKDEHLER